MTRYASDQKEKTRAAILAATAKRIRTAGLEGVGVASIMAEAGLTHGGFYAHFRSRDALLAAAIDFLFTRACETVDLFAERFGEKALSRYLDFYLSPRHRDDAEAGCPVPVLSNEVQRAAPDVKAAFETGVDRLADHLARLTPQGTRRAAIALLGEMAGVLNIARTMSDPKASASLLAGKRKLLAA